MDEADARARIAKQITARSAWPLADRVIDNSGDLAALEAQLDELWRGCMNLLDGARRHCMMMPATR